MTHVVYELVVNQDPHLKRMTIRQTQHVLHPRTSPELVALPDAGPQVLLTSPIRWLSTIVLLETMMLHWRLCYDGYTEKALDW